MFPYVLSARPKTDIEEGLREPGYKPRSVVLLKGEH